MMGLMFELDSKRLNIQIKEARDILTVTSSDILVKCYLLPDCTTSGKRKTKSVKNTSKPVWKEEFTYEDVSLTELKMERVLEVTLWDKNDFIGGLRLGGDPGQVLHRSKWMDCAGLEVSHWEKALNHPGKWIKEWHTLRPSMNPREVDFSAVKPSDPMDVPHEVNSEGKLSLQQITSVPFEEATSSTVDSVPDVQFSDVPQKVPFQATTESRPAVCT